MDGTTRVAWQRGKIEADAGGELVGLHIDRGVCYGFNATATCVWQLLEAPRTVDALVAALVPEHAVDEGRCRADLHDNLEDVAANAATSASANNLENKADTVRNMVDRARGADAEPLSRPPAGRPRLASITTVPDFIIP